MADWRVSPKYSRTQVNRAGRALVADDPDTEVLEIVNNWRASHGIPLNAIQSDLRIAARRIDPNCLLAQRLKRLSSIKDKLSRWPMPLTQMQDVGGCRAVLEDQTKARELYFRYLSSSRIGHLCWGKNDYVRDPQPTGYRGFHLKYKYQSSKADLAAHNGMRIEIQIRSQLQHLWATAVEVVGTMIGQSLKSGNGDESWLRLFALMGSILAKVEDTPIVPNTPNDIEELCKELSKLQKKLNAIDFLIGCAAGMEVLEEGKLFTSRHYFVMELDKDSQTTKVWSFTERQIRRALEKYQQRELDLTRTKRDVVLVAADDLNALKRAYPNYLLDASSFAGIMEETLKEFGN